MNEFKIHNLWPIPVYQGQIGTKNEWLDYAKSIDYERMESDNGDYSIDKFVLNKIPDLKEKIFEHLNIYAHKHLKVKDEQKFFYLNSWIVRHSKNDFAHSHFHTNSLISGVYYLNKPKNSGDLIFKKDPIKSNLFSITVKPEFKEYDYTNSDKTRVVINSGDVVLFPSHLEHSVEENTTDNVRYSLAFNFFVKGKIGEKEYELNI